MESRRWRRSRIPCSALELAVVLDALGHEEDVVLDLGGNGGGDGDTRGCKKTVDAS